MVRIESSIPINASPEKIWRLATDPRLGPRWNGNVVTVRDLEEGPLRVGTSWTQIVRILGREQEMRGEVVECNPPHDGVVRFSGPGEPVVHTHIREEGSGSILTQIMDITIPSGISGVAIKLGLPVIKEQLQEALRRQKHSAEEAVGQEMSG